jgi:hypothetical protein
MFEASSGIDLARGRLPDKLANPHQTVGRQKFKSSAILQDSTRCPGGEIGRRRGLKIPRRKACRFDSGPGHQRKSTHISVTLPALLDMVAYDFEALGYF